MQSKINYSPRALQDLDEIWDYIEFELCNPSATQNTVDGIMDKVDEIASFPESGAKLHECVIKRYQNRNIHKKGIQCQIRELAICSVR